MFSPIRTSCLIAIMLLSANLTHAAAITANGTCELGDCSSPGTLYPGSSIATTPYSFTYVFANTDSYLVTGTYSASGNAPSISFTAEANFTGNSTGTSSAADTLSVDLLQFFGYNDNPDGNYTERATLSTGNAASGSSISANLSFGGQSIGMLGPYFQSAPKVFTASADLVGLPNPALADFNYTFNLVAGTPAVPEPAEFGLTAVGMLFFLVPIVRRSNNRTRK